MNKEEIKGEIMNKMIELAKEELEEIMNEVELRVGDTRLKIAYMYQPIWIVVEDDTPFVATSRMLGVMHELREKVISLLSDEIKQDLDKDEGALVFAPYVLGYYDSNGKRLCIRYDKRMVSSDAILASYPELDKYVDSD